MRRGTNGFFVTLSCVAAIFLSGTHLAAVEPVQSVPDAKVSASFVKLSGEQRSWRDASGKYETIASLTAAGSGAVQLTRQDGKVITVPLDRLSDADRSYVSAMQMNVSVAPVVAAIQHVVRKAPDAIAPLAQQLQMVVGRVPAQTVAEPRVNLVVVRIAKPWLDKHVPREFATTQPVVDRILGYPVSGQARTRGKSQLLLLPDRDRVRTALKVNGTVHSSTVATHRSIGVHSSAVTTFQATKPVFMTERGIAYGPTQVTAQTRSSTAGIDTRPGLLGRVTRRIAQRRVDANRPAANAVAANHAEQRIARAIDAQVAASVSQLQQRYERNVLAVLKQPGSPLSRLHFTSTPEYLQIVIGGDHDELTSVASLPAYPHEPVAVYVHGSLARRLAYDASLKPLVLALSERLEAVRGRSVAARESGNPSAVRAQPVSATNSPLAGRPLGAPTDMRWSQDGTWLTLSWRPRAKRSKSPHAPALPAGPSVGQIAGDRKVGG